ncbi:MAG: hypothetical protein M1827_005760 [Pycnora praestabilis]|nr:MAG: hypothetical protein M1827_005760 [Pycnora praestabilis]
MEYFQDDMEWNPKAEKPLRIIIVGAGIAGLVAGIGLKQSGHNVVILEQVSKIAEVGAGIQVAPNCARILGRFGLLEKVMEKANMLTKNSLRRWENNEELGSAPLMPEIGKMYKSPLSVVHRGDLQRILLEAAEAQNVEIRTSSKVVKADENFGPRVQLQGTNDWISGDVVIGADGIKSDMRRQMMNLHGVTDRSSPTGDAAYRVLIPKRKLEESNNKEALKLLEGNVGMRWMGPGGHIMAYPIKNNTVYNMVLLHPDKPDSANDESWTRQGSKKEMLDFYKSWNPLVTSLLSYVPEGEVMEWTLNSHRPLPRWIQNRSVLIGDACHPMLPYVAQGAAQAIEDAGVLTVAFTKTSDVPLALEIYEAVRKARGEAIQNSAATTRKALHLDDGPEQEERDRRIRGPGKNPDLWADSEWQHFMWGTDVMKDTWENWTDYKSKVEGHALEAVAASTYT